PDETENLCQQYEKALNIKYIFTGQRNLHGKMVYRVPGFALNIGAKLSSGDVIIITCAEMFHLNNTIMQLYKPLLFNSRLLSTSIAMDDRDGSFLDYMNMHNGSFDFNAYHNNYPVLRNKLPFLMAVKRHEFFAIRGYDEDFVGFAFDDDDFISRLLKNGCRHCLTQSQTIHLFHPRHDNDYTESPEYLYNQHLYLSRTNSIIRNPDKEWGDINNNTMEKSRNNLHLK
ncbi:MAG: galactosyltransferase-related protein, partial [Syntrophomonadaceae bacterium]|nr:galactosyltransferase-related protein [Syntrophomonadaceae bacterium]